VPRHRDCRPRPFPSRQCTSPGGVADNRFGNPAFPTASWLTRPRRNSRRARQLIRACCPTPSGGRRCRCRLGSAVVVAMAKWATYHPGSVVTLMYPQGRASPRNRATARSAQSLRRFLKTAPEGQAHGDNNANDRARPKIARCNPTSAHLLARSDRACHRYAARREAGSSIWPGLLGCSISINPVNATIARHCGRSRCSKHPYVRSTAAAPTPKRTPTPSKASSRAPLAKRPRAEYLWRRRPRSSADRAPVS
jgi:hypothetical protein